ncbi:MAG: hypothetical protein ACE5R3_06425 [Nitrosopumilaceae archaeon]
MVSAHNVTTRRDIVKPLQYVGETDTVTTPANFGTTPSSATFTLVGNNVEINPQPDVQHADIAVLGSEALIAGVKTGSLYTFSFRYNPINLNLFKHIYNASGGGAASPDESLSFTYSYRLGGTEYFRHIRGFRPTSATLSVQRGVWEADISGIAKDITIPNTVDGNGGTPVYQSSETTTDPITHLDSGASPFTWNSVTYGERRFTMTCTRNLSVMDVNGETDIVYTKPADVSYSFSADVFSGTASNETALESDFENKTARAASYVFNSTGPVTLTFTNALLTAYSQVPSAGNTDALIESISARAESVTDLT